MSVSQEEIAKWSIGRLRPNPHQAELIRGMDPGELATLVKRLRQYGQEHPVEILPDGTIVDGHQTVEAAKLLGWTNIKVKIRRDLDGDDRAVKLRIIDTNLPRKHLAPIDRARLVVCKLQLEADKSGRPSDLMQETCSKEIAKSLGRTYTYRHATRLFKIVTKTPRPVQDAVAEGRLTTDEGVKIAALSEGVKDEIAATLEAGGDAKGLVAQYVTVASRAKPDVSKRLRAYLEQAGQRVEEFAGRNDELCYDGPSCQAMLDSVGKVEGFFATLKPRLRTLKVNWERAEREHAKRWAKMRRKWAEEDKRWGR
jgi:ParB-like chromosome segregation protein Spo0J